MSVEKLHIHEESVDPNYGIKYTSLKNALLNYYSTLKSIEGAVEFTIPGLEDEDIGKVSHVQFGNYPLNFINSIVGFHHFFELFINETLSQYHRILASKIEKQENLVKIFSELDSGNIKIINETVNFKFALKIIKHLEKERSNSESKFTLKPIHDFLADDKNQRVLLKLHDYRNDTLHKGSLILDYLPFDYFVTQLILPIVKNVLDIETLPFNHEINNRVDCDKDILAEIFSIKFSFNSLVGKEYSEKFADKICRLAHFKELGRASFVRPISSTKKELEKELDKEMDEIEKFMDSYKRTATLDLRKYELAEKLAIEQKKKINVHEIRTCPCCGGETLLTYWNVEIPIEGMPIAFQNVSNAICSFCSYSINVSMKEPYFYKIMEKPIFLEISEGWPFPSFTPTKKEVDDFEG